MAKYSIGFFADDKGPIIGFLGHEFSKRVSLDMAITATAFNVIRHALLSLKPFLFHYNTLLISWIMSFLVDNLSFRTFLYIKYRNYNYIYHF